VSRISVICARCALQNFALFKSRIFKFVKYTKTLSVRNQHDSDSRAFFTTYARQLTYIDRFGMLACVFTRCSRALNRVREVPRASRRKFALQSKPYTTWVSSMSPSPEKKSRHPLPNPRALALLARAVTAHCF
jgi:hypothetical protein